MLTVDNLTKCNINNLPPPNPPPTPAILIFFFTLSHRIDLSHPSSYYFVVVVVVVVVVWWWLWLIVFVVFSPDVSHVSFINASKSRGRLPQGNRKAPKETVRKLQDVSKSNS